MKTHKHIHLIPSPLAVPVLTSYRGRTWRPVRAPATRCNGMQHRNVFFPTEYRRVILAGFPHPDAARSNMTPVTSTVTTRTLTESQRLSQPSRSLAPPKTAANQMIPNILGEIGFDCSKSNFTPPVHNPAQPRPVRLRPKHSAFDPQLSSPASRFYRRLSAFIGGHYGLLQSAHPLQPWRSTRHPRHPVTMNLYTPLTPK
jgi:hypothetical protein